MPKLRLIFRVDGEVNTYLDLGRLDMGGQIAKAFGRWTKESEVAAWIDEIKQDDATYELKEFLNKSRQTDLEVKVIEEGMHDWEDYFIIHKDMKQFTTREEVERGIVITRKRRVK